MASKKPDDGGGTLNRLAGRGEEAVTKLVEELSKNPRVTDALSRVMDAKTRIDQSARGAKICFFAVAAGEAVGPTGDGQFDFGHQPRPSASPNIRSRSAMARVTCSRRRSSRTIGAGAGADAAGRAALWRIRVRARSARSSACSSGVWAIVHMRYHKRPSSQPV